MSPDAEKAPVVTGASSTSNFELSHSSVTPPPLTKADLSADEYKLRNKLFDLVLHEAQQAGEIGRHPFADDIAAIDAKVLAKIAEARQHTPLSQAMAATLQALPSLDYDIDYPRTLEHLDEPDIAEETRKLRVREAARRRLAKEQDTGPGPETPVVLADLLEEPDEDAQYRIEGLLPTGGRAGLFAIRKAGKSTLMGNVVRCLVDDYPLLGRFPVEPVERLLLIDNELDVRTLKRWFRDYGIENPDRVDVLALRGRTASFNILDPEIRAQWARMCEGVDLVIFDCLRPILDALGLSEDKDAGRFLVAFDAFLAEAGIGEAIMVHHMGHSGERARGDSRIQDWPDAIWKLVMEDPEDHTSPRYFNAYGRDVEVPEARLALDKPSRRLTIGGGSRKDGKIDGRLDAVVEFIAKSPGTSKTGIKAALPGDDKLTARAVDKAVELGLAEERDRSGRGGGKAYYPTPVSPVNPGTPQF